MMVICAFSPPFFIATYSAKLCFVYWSQHLFYRVALLCFSFPDPLLCLLSWLSIDSRKSSFTVSSAVRTTGYNVKPWDVCWVLKACSGLQCRPGLMGVKPSLYTHLWHQDVTSKCDIELSMYSFLSCLLFLVFTLLPLAFSVLLNAS